MLAYLASSKRDDLRRILGDIVDGKKKRNGEVGEYINILCS
jgi:hypothetical protein